MPAFPKFSWLRQVRTYLWSTAEPVYRLGRRPRPTRRRLKRWTVLAICAGGFVVILGFGLIHSYHRITPSPVAGTKTATTTVAPDGTNLVTRDTLPVIAAGNAKALGIAAGSSLPGLSDSVLAQRVSDIANSGAKWLRFDLDWADIQPKNAQTYDWSKYDRVVQQARKHNLKILAILTYTPAWARPADCQGSRQCAPANSQQFATFASAAVQRYKNQGVQDWEIWNEPNSKDFWRPSTSPEAYEQLLAASYKAIKAQDAAAVIITGGLSPQDTNGASYTPYDFLAGLYAAGGQRYFDAVGDHPYTFPLSPLSGENHAWNQMAAAQHSLRALLVANGDSAKKIWITEFGAPTGGPGPVATAAQDNLNQQPYVVDEAWQAKILADAVTLYASYDWVGPFLYYSYQDAGTDTSTNENFFGIVRANGSHKPAYETFKQLADTY